MGDTVDTPVEPRWRPSYDPERAKKLLAQADDDVAEQQIVVNWLWEHHDTAERQLDRLQQRARTMRERLVADGVIAS